MNHSKSAAVKLVSRDAEILNDICNNTTRDISGMPPEGNDSVRPKGVRVMPMTASIAQVNAADFLQPALKASAIERGVLAHSSSRQHELVAKGRRNRPPGLKQCLEMRLGRLLK